MKKRTFYEEQIIKCKETIKKLEDYQELIDLRISEERWRDVAVLDFDVEYILPFNHCHKILKKLGAAIQEEFKIAIKHQKNLIKLYTKRHKRYGK